MTHPPAESALKLDTDRVRVTRWRLAPGTATGFHRHALDYVIVPVAGGALTMVAPDGTQSEVAIVTGEPYARRAGIEHDVVNRTDREIVFVEIELK